jgi:N-acetylglucosamine-6-phosphate deacetylase
MPGKDADIVIFDDNISVNATIVGGRKVFQA